MSNDLRSLQWYSFLLTLTTDTGIFRVCTVMTANCIVGAIDKSGLSPSTVDIVQPDGSSSLSKACK